MTSALIEYEFLRNKDSLRLSKYFSVSNAGYHYFSFIQKLLLNIYYVLGILLGPRKMGVSKTGIVPDLMEISV